MLNLGIYLMDHLGLAKKLLNIDYRFVKDASFLEKKHKHARNVDVL
jgi:hypothetical protein